MILRKCEQYIAASRPREYLAVFIILVALIAIIFFPALHGELLIESFADRLHYPVFQFFAGELRAHGAVSLWAEYLGGFPVGLSQFGFFHPLNALYSLFDPITLYNWLILFHLAVAGFFTYIFARSALSLSRYGSLAAALVFSFNQLGVQHLTINIYANFYPLLPTLLLIVFHLHAARRRRAILLFLLFSCVAAIGWLVASTEHMFYIVLIVFGYALFLDFQRYRKDQSARKQPHPFFAARYGYECPGEHGKPPELVRRADVLRDAKEEKNRGGKTAGPGVFLFVVLAAVLSVFLVLPWLAVVRQFVGVGIRGGGYALTDRETLFNYLGATDVLKLFFPYFQIPEAFAAHFPGIASPIALSVGVLPLFLVLMGIVGMRGRREWYFFSGIALGIFLLQIRATHLSDILHRLPVFNLFRGAWKPLFFANFSLALFAGFGLDACSAMRSRILSRRLLRALKYIVVTLVAGALGVAVVLQFGAQFVEKIAQNIFYRFLYGGTAQLSSGFYDMRLTETVAQMRHIFALYSPHVLWGLLVISASFLLLLLYGRDRFSGLWFRRLALALLVADIIFTYSGFYRAVPRSSLDENPVAKFLVAQQVADAPFRADRVLFDFYYPAIDSDPENIHLDRFGERRFRFDLATLKPNMQMYYNIESAYGEDNLESRRTELLRKSFDHLAPENVPVGPLFSDEPFAVFLSSPFVRKSVLSYQTQSARRLLGMQNVRFLISPLPLKGWKKVFETTTVLNIPVYVLENSEWITRFSFVRHAVFVAGEEDAILRQVLLTDDFKKETVITCTDPRCAYLRYSASDASDTLDIEALRPGFARLHTNATGPRWLVFSESNLPAWEARIDGRETDIETANFLFQAVYVPSGEHEVEFRYPEIMKQFRSTLNNLLNDK